MIRKESHRGAVIKEFPSISAVDGKMQTQRFFLFCFMTTHCVWQEGNGIRAEGLYQNAFMLRPSKEIG